MSAGDVMDSMVTIVNSTIVCFKVVTMVDLKSYHHTHTHTHTHTQINFVC